uniref:Phlebovirus glycoprotein G2 fusion domain-containing protein n=1 Tax=Parascaris equorum TaxID=6256 RepID=A0A914RN44_PAREQ
LNILLTKIIQRVNEAPLIELRELRINNSCTREIRVGVVINASCCQCWEGRITTLRFEWTAFGTMQEQCALSETRKTSYLRHPPGSTATSVSPDPFWPSALNPDLASLQTLSNISESPKKSLNGNEK